MDWGSILCGFLSLSVFSKGHYDLYGEGSNTVDKGRIDRGLTDAAWVWGIGSPVFELYDVQTNLSYWVREIPTPQKAAELLGEYGGPPEEERGNPYRTPG